MPLNNEPLIGCEKEYDGSPFTPDYAADVIKGYAGFWKKGKRTWKVDKCRRRRLDWLVEKLDLKKRDTVLEIGCGFGPLVYRCIKKAEDCRCLGIDLSSERLLPARDYFEKEGLCDSVLFCLANGKRLPVKAGAIDKILLIDVLEHMSDEDKKFILKESFRVLSRGGILLINTPNLSYLELRLKIKKLLYRLCFKDTSKVDIPHTPTSIVEGDHIGLSDAFSLRKILNDTGFWNVRFLLKTDNAYGKVLWPLWAIWSQFKERFAQSITLKCFKGLTGPGEKL